MSQSNINVSVIIINYNTYNLTTNCLRSIYTHTKGVVTEVILVDNASTECDADIFKAEFSEIILIKSATNLGFAGGNNLGIDHAKGEYILLLNSDTELVNNAIRIAYDKIKSDQSIGALSARCNYPDGTPQSVAGRFPSIKTELFELTRISSTIKGERRARLYLGDFWDYNKTTEADWIWGTFFMIPKKVLDLFPGKRLHQDFFMYYEDVLWCYYIKEKCKLKIVYYPEAIVIHHLSGSSLVTNAKDNFRAKMLPNEYKFLVKEKGKFYTTFFYLIKALHHLTLRKKESVEDAVFYLKFINR